METVQRNETHGRVTEEVTRLLAAVALADHQFPNLGDLPRLAQVPYNSLGHLVLLDYRKLAMVLWGTVAEIQASIRKNTWIIIAPVVAILVGAVSVFAAFFFIDWWSVPVGLLIGGGAYRILRPDIGGLIAEVRARNMQILLEGKFPASAGNFEQKLTGKIVEWGNGEVSDDLCPVLVVTEPDEPFPAYGRLQSTQLFVCRPENEQEAPDLSPRSLEYAVSEALTSMASSTGISCVTTGRIVLIDGQSLRKTSPWLARGQGGDHPPLFLNAEEIPDVHDIDPEASVRVYSCIQAVVPEYMMFVSFFVRTFLAGNSAACEVSVSTLGPPSRDWNYIRGRLNQKARESKAEQLGEQSLDQQTEETSRLGARLQFVRMYLDIASQTSQTFQAPRTVRSLLRLDPFARKAMEHEKKHIDRIVEHQEIWAGIYTTIINWREQNSLTFTTGFFGNAESQAVVRTLYDRICRCALERLKELGFDISEYKDDKGKFSINAAQISQLVVGERVYMEKDKRSERATENVPRTISTGESS